MFPDGCPVAHPSAQRLRLAEDQRMLTAGAILLTSQQQAPEEGLGGGGGQKGRLQGGRMWFGKEQITGIHMVGCGVVFALIIDLEAPA